MSTDLKKQTSSMNWKITRSSSRLSAILLSVTQITWTERGARFDWLTVTNNTFANHSHVKYEFANTKKLVKKLARIETSSTCR